MTEITQELLRERFIYRDGSLYWRAPGKKRNLEKPVGTLSKDGYLHVNLTVNKKARSQLLHRLIYLYHHETLPKIIDHVDNNPLNNVIHNLRPATQSENCQNRKVSLKNKSGKKGVSWCANTRRWVVQIYKNKRHIFKRRFKDFELACFVADVMRSSLHNSFARHK